MIAMKVLATISTVAVFAALMFNWLADQPTLSYYVSIPVFICGAVAGFVFGFYCGSDKEENEEEGEFADYEEIIEI